jgi:hypothetical protein
MIFNLCNSSIGFKVLLTTGLLSIVEEEKTGQRKEKTRRKCTRL